MKLYVHHIAISTETLTNRLQEIWIRSRRFASFGAMLSFLFIVVLFCPLLTSSKNAIKANVEPVNGQAFQSDQNLKMEPAFHSDQKLKTEPAFHQNLKTEPAFHSNLKMEPAPEFDSKDICGDPECDLVCAEGQVGHDCNEDHDGPLVHQGPHQ